MSCSSRAGRPCVMINPSFFLQPGHRHAEGGGPLAEVLSFSWRRFGREDCKGSAACAGKQ